MGVMARINKIGTHLEGRYVQASAAKGGHQSKGQGGFAGAAVGAGYDDAFGDGALPSVSAHPEMASCGPAKRSRVFVIMAQPFIFFDVAPLRLRLRKHCGLGLNHNLPFLDGHQLTV